MRWSCAWVVRVRKLRSEMDAINPCPLKHHTKAVMWSAWLNLQARRHWWTVMHTTPIANNHAQLTANVGSYTARYNHLDCWMRILVHLIWRHKGTNNLYGSFGTLLVLPHISNCLFDVCPAYMMLSPHGTQCYVKCRGEMSDKQFVSTRHSTRIWGGISDCTCMQVVSNLSYIQNRCRVDSVIAIYTQRWLVYRFSCKSFLLNRLIN